MQNIVLNPEYYFENIYVLSRYLLTKVSYREYIKSTNNVPTAGRLESFIYFITVH